MRADTIHFVAEETINRKRKYAAWAGSYGDLVRLLRAVERQFELMIPAHIEERTDLARGRVAYIEDQIAELQGEIEKETDSRLVAVNARYLERAQSQLAEAQQEVNEKTEEARGAGRIRVTVSHSGDRWTSVGTPEQVAAFIDGRRFDSLTFEGPSDYRLRDNRVRIEADRNDGVELHISATDDQWATATTTYLDNELQERLPWWRFIRSSWFLITLFLIAFLVGLWFPLGLAASWAQGDAKTLPDGAATALLSVYLVAAIVLTAFAVAITKRFVPAFDIAPDGKRNRGVAVIAVFGSAAGAIVLGVATNLLSAGLTG